MAQEQTLRIRSADGAEAEATLFLADEGTPRVLLVCTPAMGVAAAYYAGLARTLARPGIAVVIAELRGIGSSSVRARRGVDFGYRELVFLDLPAVISAVRALYPQARLVLFGHSIGAHIGAMYASIHAGEVAALVFAAAGTSYFRSWRFPHNLGLFLFALAARVTSAALGYFPGRRFGVFGTEARRLIGEWATLAIRGRFEVQGSPQRFEDELARVDLPVLALSFEGDFFAPQAAVEHLLRKMPRARITRRHLRAVDLGAPAVDHFRWTRYPIPVADAVAQWIRAL